MSPLGDSEDTKSLLGLMLRLLVARGWKEEEKNDLQRLNWFVGIFRSLEGIYHVCRVHVVSNDELLNT